MTLARCFGVFGDPIAHSRSPIMHAAAFAVLGLPHRYLAFEVSPGRLPAAIRGAAALGFGGVNLTVPHKQAALSICDRLSDTARRIAAVNTLCFRPDPDSGAIEIVGHNTDGRGFFDALGELPGAPPKQATLLGSGGASLAVADALLHNFPDLTLLWVSRRPAEIALAEHPRVQPLDWQRLGALRGDLLINATTVGLSGGPEHFPIELELDELEPGARVIDIVYPRPPGGLLDRAALAGHAVQDGLPMLLWQGVRALELWLGGPLPETVIQAMRTALYSN